MSDSFFKDIISFISVSSIFVSLLVIIWFLYIGVWPVFGAVGSGSMKPNINEDETILLGEPNKYGPDTSHHGITTYRQGKDIGFKKFNEYGHVIVFKTEVNDKLIMHRAMFWVEKGENWIKKANQSKLPAESINCTQVESCPAPRDGFITKGDNNNFYDQSIGIARIVRPGDIYGVSVREVPIQEIRLVLLLFIVGAFGRFLYKRGKEKQEK